MTRSFFRPRLILFLTFVFFSSIYLEASTIIWKGTDDVTNWHDGDSWIGGVVPSIIDSVIIRGGSETALVNVIISSAAEARHIKIEDYCILSTLFTGSLRVGPVLGEAIMIDKEASLINFGDLLVVNALNGIVVKGSFENHGDSRISGLVNSVVDYEGIFMSDSSIVKNFGTLLLEDLNIAISLEDDASFENQGMINIEVCKSGISSIGNTLFENKSRIDFSEIENFGIFNIGSFINNGPMLLNNAGKSNLGAAISNLTFGFNASFVNNSNIVMSNLEKTAIRNAGPAAFMNNGIIIIQDKPEYGLDLNPFSTFEVSSTGSLVVPAAVMSSLIVHDEAIFDIANGAVLTVKDQ